MAEPLQLTAPNGTKYTQPTGKFPAEPSPNSPIYPQTTNTPQTRPLHQQRIRPRDLGRENRNHQPLRRIRHRNRRSRRRERRRRRRRGRPRGFQDGLRMAEPYASGAGSFAVEVGGFV
jgi:hypothetical protein